MTSSTLGDITDANGQNKGAGHIRRRQEAAILRAAEEEFASFGFKGARMAEIAKKADLPKANIHYYFKNKLGLYIALLSDVLKLWDHTFSNVTADDDPAEVIKAYIDEKMAFSRQHPLASRIFATEIISGAPNMRTYFDQRYRDWFAGRTDVLKAWIKQGKMDDISAEHLIFIIWASTQHYADFSTQVASALGKEGLDDGDYQAATDTLTHIILKGCGVRG